MENRSAQHRFNGRESVLHQRHRRLMAQEGRVWLSEGGAPCLGKPILGRCRIPDLFPHQKLGVLGQGRPPTTPRGRGMSDILRGKKGGWFLPDWELDSRDLDIASQSAADTG